MSECGLTDDLALDQIVWQKGFTYLYPSNWGKGLVDEPLLVIILMSWVYLALPKFPFLSRDNLLNK